MTDKEKRNVSRNQARNMDSVRKQLEGMTKEYGGSFILLGSFPNFVQQTTQECATGEGLAFLQTPYGKHLGGLWTKHNMKIQDRRVASNYWILKRFLFLTDTVLLFVERKEILRITVSNQEHDLVPGCQDDSEGIDNHLEEVVINADSIASSSSKANTKGLDKQHSSKPKNGAKRGTLFIL